MPRLRAPQWGEPRCPATQRRRSPPLAGRSWCSLPCGAWRSFPFPASPGSLLLALCAAATAGAQPVPAEEGYIGARACAACHPDNYASQSRSGHARALFPASQHPLLGEVFSRGEWERPPGAHFAFLDSPGGPRVRASFGERHLELPIEWAFGSGDQGITFVSRLEQERYIEYSFTWYAATRAIALTAGHPDRPPASLAQALGVVYDAFSVPASILACFQCHSTGPVAISDDFEIQPAELGVRCEVCHGPGQQHAAAAGQGHLEQAKALIRNPAVLGAVKINELCGNCHRLPPAAGQTFDFSNPWHVRHQPPYLSQSRCFRESQGALSCLTCHDPHEKLQRNDPAHYNAQCTACHPGTAASHADAAAHPPPAADADTASHPKPPAGTTTPLTDCIACHMPKVRPQPYLAFTNHWIGIYQDQQLKPLR